MSLQQLLEIISKHRFDYHVTLYTDFLNKKAWDDQLEYDKFERIRRFGII